jgi:flagellin FlaB
MLSEELSEELKNRVRGQVGIGTLIVFIAMVLVAAIAAGVLINTAGFLQSKSEATGQQSGEQVTNRLQVLQTSGLKTAKDDDDEIGAITLTATKAPGAEDIGLDGLTMQVVDDQGTFDLVIEEQYTGTVDGAFAHEPVKDEDGSLDKTDPSPVINEADDRVNIVIDVGDADYIEDSESGDTDFSTDADTGKISSVYDALEDEVDGSPALDDERTELHEGQNLDPIEGVGPTDRIIRSGSGTGGYDQGATASIRITTASGTASTVQIVVPESLTSKTAVRL